LQTLSSRLTILFLSLVVLPSVVLSLVSLAAIRTEHHQLLELEQERIQGAARRLAAALVWRLGEHDRALVSALGQAAAGGAGLGELARMLDLTRDNGYAHAALMAPDGRTVPGALADADAGAERAAPPTFPGPALRKRALSWLSDPSDERGYVVEPGADGRRRVFYGALVRAAPDAPPLGLVLLEPDVERQLAREVEALTTMLGDREEARFAIVRDRGGSFGAGDPGAGGAVAADAEPPSGAVLAAELGAGAAPAAATRTAVVATIGEPTAQGVDLGLYPLPFPLDHLAIEVTAVASPPEGALGAMSKRLHVWAIAFILCGLLAGATVTTLAVNREVKAAALKSDFVTTVTHELKTPLTSIGMFAETLLMGRIHDKEEEQECLEIIVRETERLSRLIDRVLTFSKIEAQKKRFDLRLTDLRQLAQDAIELFQTQMRTAPDPVAIEMAELADLPPVLCDRAALQEVLLNLFSNAYKYSRWRRSEPGASSAGDSVESDAGDTRPRRIRVTVTKRRRWAMIAVRDWGVGISRTEQRKIFRKFYRANDVLTRDVEGSGIGLSLARSIMRAHRGDITVRSRLGQGSTFTLWLPR
jgi:signal transduction histidine kinase